jgi:hypothetical protein
VSAQMFYFASTLLVIRILVSSEYGVMAFADFWTDSSRHACRNGSRCDDHPCRVVSDSLLRKHLAAS